MNLAIVENMRKTSEQLRCHSKVYKTKEIIQQKAILGNLLNINEHNNSSEYYKFVNL